MNHRTVETPYIPLNPKTAKTIYYLKIYIYIFFHRGLHVSNKKQPLVPSKAPLGCKPGKHKLQLGDELSLPAAQVPGSPPGQRAASPKQRRTEPGEPQRFLCIVLGVSLIYIYMYVANRSVVTLYVFPFPVQTVIVGANCGMKFSPRCMRL